jgi:AAA ATPase domain
MHIKKVVIKNYRCLKDTTVDLNAHLNILVGNNECGKSTFLEAVHLALSGLLNGRSVHTELHSHLFNSDITTDYIQALKTSPKQPPSILIELYIADVAAVSRLKGRNNSLKQDAPGLKILVEFNEDFKTEYATYIADPSLVKSIPVEYYVVRWRDFADNEVTARSIPIKPCFIDASTIRNNNAASRYILDTVKEGLSKKQQVDLALSYRMMKDRFLTEKKVADINKFLAKKKGHVSDKALSISLDTSARASWETYRCNQHIADVADAFFPLEPRTKSLNEAITGHDGVFAVPIAKVAAYIEKYRPQVLRLDVKTSCHGYPAMNFGESKGLTFERVLIFPHKLGQKWLSTGDVVHVEKSAPKMYVGVSRARHSVAFVHDGNIGAKGIIAYQ